MIEFMLLMSYFINNFSNALFGRYEGEEKNVEIRTSSSGESVHDFQCDLCTTLLSSLSTLFPRLSLPLLPHDVFREKEQKRRYKDRKPIVNLHRSS